ncbi:uncharacterized protein EDB93DRAFT_1246765 [Suillus bovinus]|uniref:uncharacterized protein n=1 Tax=Suillus bovinus TaxID=48563 RepID=UPI001B86DF5A|nr:uncharacterized protein EDB93DRAFT_1246765 [Suillus bovinus]KAG2157709.1 hypothetical protein EDB93DRAFT_1246765 [Suillus bovinus]
MGLPSDTFDYVQEQTKLKATLQDVGLVKGASIRRLAYQESTVGAQDPSAHSGAPDLPHLVPDGSSTGETSLLTVHPANSRYTSPFPTPSSTGETSSLTPPAPLQDVFYGSMDQQHPWIDPSSSDMFSMMGSEPFLPYNFPVNLLGQPMASYGCSQDPHATNATTLTNAIGASLKPVASSPHDAVPPLPVTHIIPPMPFKDGGSQSNTTTSTNIIGASASGSSLQMDMGAYPSTGSCEHFPEEHELVTHQEGLSVTGRRSAELNGMLDAGFVVVERHFLNLSASTTLSVSQLINVFLKSCGRTVNGTNYWNLYTNYFKEHIQTELAHIGREVPPGGATVHKQCYKSFKDTYPDSYQDLLLMHEEASLLGSTPQTIAQHGQGFQKHYRRVIQILESASIKSGFEAAIVLCGKVVNEDGLLSYSYNTPGAAGFWETRCRASNDAIIGHLKAHMYNRTSLAAVDEAFDDGTHNAPSTPNSTSNNNHDRSQTPEGRDDGLKWVKLELIKQVAQLGGRCAWDKNFPWKGMSRALADANLCIKGYPTHKCLLPGEAHNENSKNKGIGALTQKEIVVLMDALKAGTMQVAKVDKTH